MLPPALDDPTSQPTSPDLTPHPLPRRLQLKSKIVKQRSLADERERRKNLTKYIPDVARAIFGML